MKASHAAIWKRHRLEEIVNEVVAAEFENGDGEVVTFEEVPYHYRQRLFWKKF